MFLTRIGFNSKAVVTGDITQMDLPRNVRSGLRHAIEVLSGVEGLSFNFFQAGDRITSYNVCYTKLLRPSTPAIPPLEPMIRRPFSWLCSSVG